MTAALRGFNMELNETSAQRVNDVYSNLAANAAANTQEIADAMTRTASIANAAGMEFETTAAFLTQMIETTRESAENLGTAMKTIVARFTEMKKSPNEIIDVEGEEVSANKVEAALKSVGVELRDTNGQFRDLDDVFLELASKWDSLDKMSQRYVATTAAGSRQQSRFIAMMSNYQRTMELTSYATNSAGASQRQFEKTMDSLESKLNRLHDVWEQFTTGIANQSAIKGVVDLLTGFLTAVNNLTDALDPLHTGWSKILAAFLGFKAAKGVVNGVLRGVGTQLGTRNKTGLDEKQGAEDGVKYGKGFWGAFKKISAQRKAGTMPLTEGTKATKEAMKAQGISTKRFTLTGKDVNAAKIFKDQSNVMKEQSNELNKLSSSYKKYSSILKEDSTKTDKLNALRDTVKAEKEYQKTLNTSTKEGQAAMKASQHRVDILGAEQKTIEQTTTTQELKNGATNQEAFSTYNETIATDLNTASEELNEKAKEANTTATVLEGKAIDEENIKTQAGNMTKAQAILALFSLNREKRLAAAATLGLVSAEELHTLATEGATGATTAFSAALYSLPIMWIVAGVAALTAGLIALAVVANEFSLEKQLEKANSAAEEAAKEASNAADAYDELLEGKDKYNSLQEELQSLQKGTIAFKEKVLEANQAVLDLLEKYPSLSKYMTNEKGILTISDTGWNQVVEEQQKRLSGAQIRANATKLYSLGKQSQKNIADSLSSILGYTPKGYVSNTVETYTSEDISREKQKDFYDSIISFYKSGDIKQIAKKDEADQDSQIVEQNGKMYSISQKALETLQNIETENGETIQLTNGSLATLASSAADITKEDNKIKEQTKALTLTLANSVTNSMDSSLNDSVKDNLASFITDNLNQGKFEQEIDERIDFYGRGKYWGWGSYQGENSTGEGLLRYEAEQEGIEIKDENGDFRNIESIRRELAAGDITAKHIESAAESFEKLYKKNASAATNLLALSNNNLEALQITSEQAHLLIGTDGAAAFVDGLKTALGEGEIEELFTNLGADSADGAVEGLKTNAETLQSQYKAQIRSAYKVLNSSTKTDETSDYEGMLSSLEKTFGSLSNVNKYVSLFNKWQKDSGLVFNGLLEGIDSSTLSGTFYEVLSKIDFTNSIQAAKQIQEISKSTNKEWQKIGSRLDTYASSIITAQKQIKQVFDSIDPKKWEELTKDTVITKEEINDLKSELPELQEFLDNTGISANTVSKYFSKMADNALNINNVSSKFIEALDKINSAINNIEDSIDFVENFEVSASSTGISESFSEYRDSMKQSLERGQYGDRALIDYTKMILGNENFEEYYKEFEGNLQKIEELAFSKINLWGDNFYGLWTSFSELSDFVNVGTEGEINFDLTNVKSIDDISKALQDKLNISEEVAKAAISDAQTYSSNFSEALNSLMLGDAISTLLEGAISFDNIKYINEQEIAILANEIGIDGDKLKEQIQKELNEANIKFKFTAEPVIDENGRLTQEVRKIIQNQIEKDFSAKDSKINLDVYYSSLLAKGLSSEQAEKEIGSILEELSKNKKFANIKIKFDNGVLEKVGDDAQKTFANAISDGTIQGFKDPKVRYAELQNAEDTGKEFSKQIALGMYAASFAMKGTLTGKGFSEAQQTQLERMYSLIEGTTDKAIEDYKALLIEQSQDTDTWQQIGQNVGDAFNNGLNAVTYDNFLAQLAGKTGGSYGEDNEKTKDSETEDSDWENNYDKYYNALKRIEGIERERNKLAREQEKLTKRRFMDEEALKKNKQEQIALLKQQASINEQLANTAASYLRGDSNGDVWFDSATGTIQTNPNAAYYDKDQKEAFDKQLSLMENNYETWKTAIDNLDTIYDAIEELTQIVEFTAEDFTNNIDRVIEVLDNTLSNFSRELERSERYDSGITGKRLKNLYEQNAQTLVDKYNQLTQEKAINEQLFNGQLFSEYGKYLNYNWDTKEVTKSGLYYTITDPQMKEKVDKFYDETVSLGQAVIDIDNQQEDIKDEFYDLKKNLLDKSLEFQEKVYDAVIKLREDEINNLNNIDNSIKNAASDLISSVQKNLQKLRQDRQNTKTEEELQNMEARLAYYQVDTSNANQKNILDLQKQLTDKQQSYTDSLIDQKISELQQQNDEAAAQRKRQIEIMETQLELDKENGVIWKAVDNALKVGFDSSGKIQKGSDLYNMLASLDEVTKKNSMQFERWFGELSNLAAAYNTSLTVDFGSENQMSNAVANSNDVFGENSPYIKSLKEQLEAMNRDGNFNHLMWYDQEGQQMRYKYSYYEASSDTEAKAYNDKVNQYETLAAALANARAFYRKNRNASFTSAFKRLYGYDSGGLADYTGPAWLDGTKSSPELVLNPRDTENFIQLKDILANVMTNKPNNANTNGDFYFEIHIDVDKITSDYDVDQIASRIKQQITNEARYRNVNTINMIR